MTIDNYIYISTRPKQPTTQQQQQQQQQQEDCATKTFTTQAKSSLTSGFQQKKQFKEIDEKVVSLLNALHYSFSIVMLDSKLNHNSFEYLKRFSKYCSTTFGHLNRLRKETSGKNGGGSNE